MSIGPTPDLYEVTLASIGDAVIVTDLNGSITFVNHVAERLTGWPSEEAKGRPLSEVFRIVNEATRAPAANPAERALKLGHVVGLANHTILISRDGVTEYAIDDSAAPIADESGHISGVVLVFRDITDRKRAEAALRESEGRHRILYAIASAVQPLTDARAIMAETARLLCEHLNADRCAYAEVVDGDVFRIQGDYCRGTTSIVGDWRIADFGPDCLRSMKANEPFILENSDDDARVGLAELPAYRATQIRAAVCVPLHKGGRLVAAMAVHQASLRRWSEAEVNLVTTVVGRCWESIERARVTAESERRKRLYETILSNTPDLAYVWDLDHRFTYVNEGLLRMWGRTWDEAIGRNCLELGYEPWHAAMHDREIEIVKSTKLPVRGEVPFTGTFGRRDYDYILVPVLGADGEIEAVAGTTRDVTDRRTAETGLQEQHRVLETLYAIGSKLTAEVDLARLVQALTDETTALTDAAFGAFFYNAQDAGGGTYLLYTLSGAPKEAFDKFPHPRATAIFEPTFKGLGVMRLDDVTQDPRFGRNDPYHGQPEGHLPVRSYLAVPVKSRSGEVLGGLFFGHPDTGVFTERHERMVVAIAAHAAVAIDNARLYEWLRETDRRKDEFLATLAHELRNPLAPVRTGIQVLKSAPEPAEATQTLDMMERQVSHLARLVDDLMDVARVTSGKIKLRRERLDLRTVVGSAVEATRPILEAGRHALSISLSGEALPVVGDLTRLAQVLTNLLTNAAKYTRPGGRIEIAASKEGNAAVVRVTDNGIGIQAEMLPKVFDMFAQVDSASEHAQGGLGIGLTLVRKLVEMHKGTVAAESPGENLGSAFIVQLPLDTGDALAFPPEIARQDSEILPRSLSVLVVDDNKDGASSLALLLKLAGHESRVAHTGAEGVQIAREFRPDVVFLDIGLPGMNGYEVARRLRQEHSIRHSTIVALTGWGAEEDRRQSKEAGFDEHLTKPVDISDVNRILASASRRTK